MADKPNGTLSRPREVAQLINRMTSMISYGKKLQPFVDKLDDNDKVYLTRVNKDGVQLESELLEMLNIVKTMKELYGESNYSIPLIAINHDAFKLVTPPFITQLITHGMPVIFINLINNTIVDYQSPWFTSIFKSWILPNDDGQVKQTVSEGEKHNFVLANINNIPMSILKSKSIVSFKGMEILNMHHSSLKVKNMRGNQYINMRLDVEVIETLLANRTSSNVNPDQLKRYMKPELGRNISLLYEEIFEFGVPALGPNNFIGLYDKIVGVIKIPVAPVALEAFTFVRKIKDRIKNLQYRSVNIVIIANKASGKSKLTELMKNILESKLNERVDVISSDAYGIWRSHVTDDSKAADVDLKSVIAYDGDEKQVSYYYIVMKRILEKYKIDSIIKYENMSTNKRHEINNIMNGILVETCKSSTINGEFYFYDQLATHADRARVTIYEAHFPALDAVLPRSELTSRLVPQLDNRLAVINRTKDVVDLALYDTYEIYNSRGHIRMYPSDWIYLLNSVIE